MEKIPSSVLAILVLSSELVLGLKILMGEGERKAGSVHRSALCCLWVALLVTKLARVVLLLCFAQKE